jgi:predicted ATPase/DNA-binding SARP family transcriptional activator
MARIEMFLLGSPRLEREGVPLQFDTHKILALAAYVAVSDLESPGTPVGRESLVALLWPELEPGRARAVLRRNLSLLRSALQGEWLLADRHTLTTDPQADFWLDVAQFRRLVRAGAAHDHPQDQPCPRCLEDLAAAAALYRGDFLEGFGLRDTVAFDEWQFFQAEGLRQELAGALQRLARGHSLQGDPEAALPYARRWLALDPLHEPAHRQLMALYAAAGRRSAALRQYDECRRILDEELGLPPAAETTALYEQIRTAPPPEAAGLARPVAPPRHNLPAQATPFVGREQERAEISARLRDPACRLLTLLGPGGIGKTRLALRLAEDLAETQPPPFEQGVFFVPLAPIQAAEGVVPAVAEAVGYCCLPANEGNGRASPRQQLLDYLGHRQVLLVMDNYEHLLPDQAPHDGQDGSPQDESTAFVTDLLAAAPDVKLLVTSRARLQVQGEHLYPLAGLRVPDARLPAPSDPRQALQGYSAVALFVQAARRARPDFELRARDLPPVADVCRLVQGMPLAIVLAAAWVAILDPAEIAAEIRRSLDFLETGLRDVPSRQRSIRAAFDHSWRLLGEHERTIFRALSVFHGGFTREAARAVAGASLPDLMSLVDKSLLLPSSPGRYELHELLRQYGVERLDGVPAQAGAVRDRHCAYYSAALERWAADLRGPGQQQAADEMDLEVENARVAWYWAVAHTQLDRLARSVDGLWLYHARRMRYEEAEAAFRAGVHGLEALDDLTARRLRARLLVLWSTFHLEMGHKTRALEIQEQGLALLLELERAGHDVRHEMALAMLHQSRLDYYYRPDPLEARQHYEQSVAMYERLGDRWGLARALDSLGWVVENLGRFAEAGDLCRRSLAIRRELGDRRGMADAMLNLGIISWVQGQWDEADRWLHDSLGIFRALDDWNHVARTIKSIGEVQVRRGRFADGLVLLESSSEAYEDLGSKFNVLGMLPFLGEARLHLGHYAEARADAERGEQLAARFKHLWGVAFCQFIRGLAVLGEGDAGQALDLFRRSVANFDQVRHPENRGWALGPLGLAARATGDTALARRSVAGALQTGLDLGAVMPLLYGLPAAAVLVAARGDEERAADVYAALCRWGFVAGSHWFHDVVGRRLRVAAPAAADQPGQMQDLLDLAAGLLAGW